jgi:dTDP-4-amino-4,6-dideoxygalactose transaminase
MSDLAIHGGIPIRVLPYPAWPQAGPEERAWLEKVLGSTRWFAGPRGDDPDSLGSLFARKFAELHGGRFAQPVANGSVAIEVALRAIGLKPGDEVIVPSYTFVSTATSVLMVGGIPVFADIDPDSYCISPGDAARLIGPGTRAIIPVHLGGQMADMSAISELAEKKGLMVIEDSAQAIGSVHENRGAGTWGDLGTFSFQANKTITAGEGGLIMSSSPRLAERVTALTAFGRFAGEKTERSSAFPSQMLSSNYRLSEVQAAVLLGQLEKFGRQDERRRTNASRLTKNLRGIPGVEHVRADSPGSRHSYYYYLVRYDPGVFGNLAPAEMCRILNAEGIPFVPGDSKPIYRNPVFEPGALSKFLCPQVLKRYEDSVRRNPFDCPMAEDACKRTLILRHQVLLGDTEGMDHISDALGKVLENLEKVRKVR